jgi:hypothetical protein
LGSNDLPTPFRPLPIRAFNAFGRMLERVGVEFFHFDDVDLMRRATRASKLDDFGEDSFRSGLRKLVESLHADAGLSPFGRFLARTQLIELLVHRLEILDYRKHHPEVAHHEIRRPLVIMGLPRTGTTLLYGLLAEDPANRAPLSWEIDAPLPPAETASYETDPRIAATQKRFDQLGGLAPGFQAIHPIGALMPQECIVPMASQFMSLRFEMCFDVASYQSWMMDQDMRPAYRFYRKFLQHMQSRHACERWVLKSPGHLGPIDALFDIFPDAQLVQTHRDPVRIIPSVSSLEFTMRQAASDTVDPIRQGRQMLTLWSRMLEQGMRSRRAHPEREAQILDLHMHEIVADPIGCIRRIYEHFELPISDEFVERMQAYIAEHPREEFGKHSYSLEAFGLEESEINEAFEDYTEYFGVKPEPFSL